MKATNWEYENYKKDCENQGIKDILDEEEWENIQQEISNEFYSCQELVRPSK